MKNLKVRFKRKISFILIVSIIITTMFGQIPVTAETAINGVPAPATITIGTEGDFTFVRPTVVTELPGVSIGTPTPAMDYHQMSTPANTYIGSVQLTAPPNSAFYKNPTDAAAGVGGASVLTVQMDVSYWMNFQSLSGGSRTVGIGMAGTIVLRAGSQIWGTYTPAASATKSWSGPSWTDQITVHNVINTGGTVGTISHFAPIINDIQPSPLSQNTNYNFNAGTLGDGDVVAVLGDTYNITDGLRARLGKSNTTNMTLQPTGTPTGIQGLVEHVSGIEPPTAGGNFTTIGVYPVTQKITDRDGDSTTFTRSFTIKSLIPPSLIVNYAASAVDENGTPLTGSYGGEWTNQPLEVLASSTDTGTYDTTIRREANPGMDDWSEVSRSAGNNHSIDPYTTEATHVDGHALVSELFATSSPTNSLSPKSAQIVVKVDNTAPTLALQEPADWATAPGTVGTLDTLSGLETGTGGIYYKFLPSTVMTPPLYTDSGWHTDYADAYTDTVPGNYNLWAYAKDNATNKSTVIQVNTSVISILSSLSPVMTGVEDISSDTIASGDWANESLNVTTTKPADPLNEIPTPNYIKVDSPLDTLTTPNDGAISEHTTGTETFLTVPYTHETDGITVTGVIIDTNDGTGAALTQSGDYIVRIDKTAPTAAGSITHITGNTYDFNDAGSADNQATNGANGSGIDPSSTKFAVVPKGTAPPSTYASYDIDNGETRDLTALGAGTFEVYTIVKDNAGNVSTPSLLSSEIAIKGTAKATLGGVYSTNTIDALDTAIAAGTSYTSNEWSNVPIDLTGGKNALPYIGNHNVDINDGSTTVAAGSGNNGADVLYPASVEGTTSYHSVVVNTNGPKDELSLPSDTLIVRIDTRAPSSNLNSTDNWVTITDTSVDDTVITTDVSGIYKTYVKYIPAGEAAPAISDTGWIDASTAVASLTTTGVWDVYSYTVDNAGNKSVVANEDVSVEVASTIKPLISAIYTAGATDVDGNIIAPNTPYDGAWTNDGVDITVVTTDIAAGLYGALYNGGTLIDSGAISALSYTKALYNVDSLTNVGTTITGRISSNAALSVLSQPSDNLIVKVDTVVPVTAIVPLPGGATFADASTDALSGIHRTMVAYVAKDASAPALSDYAEISSVVIGSPGEYDVYSYSLDNAGNRSSIVKHSTPVQVVSSAQAKIKVTYEVGGVDTPYIDGTWINKDATITVSKPDGFTYVGAHNSALKYNIIASLGTGSDNTGGDYEYTTSVTLFNEDVFGIMVDSVDNAISAASGTINVKVDKIAPEAKAGFVAATCEILDQSIDGLLESGIDSSKTKVAIVPHNDPAPTTGDFIDFVAGMTIPQDSTYYDVYMIATDIAGNESAITKVLNNRSDNPKDAISASDFERGINEGTILPADAKTLSDVSGNYYSIGPVTPILVNDIIVDATLLTAINTKITGGTTGKNDLTFYTPVSIYQEQADIKVTIYQHGNSGLPGDERIYGNDFLYATSQGSLDETRAKSLAAILARESDLSTMDLSKVTVDTTELAALNTAIANKDIDNNTWPLTFTTPGGASVTVGVSLYNNVNPNPPQPGVEAIAANDFNFGMDNGNLDEALAKELSSVLAIDEFSIAIPTASLTARQADLDVINAAIAVKDKSGNPFSLTFTTPGGTSVVAKVTLFDNSNPPIPGQAKIVANDIHYGIDKGNINDALAKYLSQVSAVDAASKKVDINDITVNVLELAAINAAIDALESGAYNLTFTEISGEAVTIKVTLYKNSSKEPPAPSTEGIYANDFSYGISSGALNASDSKILSSVYAHYANGNSVAFSDINVKASDLATINAAIAANDKSGNPFELTFISPSGKEATVKVTLKDNGPTGPVISGQEYITGDNFGYGINQGALSESDARLLARLQPIHSDGTTMDLSDVTADTTELAAINAAIMANDKSDNPFDLTFTTIGGVSVTVKVTLYDYSNPVQPGNAFIVGNDFVYGIEQGTLSDGLARMYANASAVDKDGKAILPTDITVDATELAAINTAIANKDKSGNQFTLTFTEPTGESVSIKVTLKDNGNGPTDEHNNSERISADNFFYGINEGALNAAKAKALAGVVAFEDNGKAMDLSQVSISASELAILNAAIAANDKSNNPFDLTFITPDGTSVTVKVTLKDVTDGVKDPTDPTKDTDRIGADDFFYGINQGSLDKDDAKLMANVEAVDKDGKAIDLSDVTTSPTQLLAINDAIKAGQLGEYPLTFTTPGGASTQVTVILKGKGAGDVDPSDPTNPLTNTDRIAGNDFIYGLNEGTLTDIEAKIRAQVEAVDKAGKAIPSSDIIADVVELKAINDAIEKGQTGDFPLTYTTVGGAEITVNITLKDHSVAPDIDPHNPEKTTSGNIGANGFMIGVNEKNALTANEAKIRSYVAAKDIFGNDYPLSSITVSTSELQTINNAKAAGQSGTFPLTFTSPEGKSVTVDVTILKKVNPPVVNPSDPSKNEGSIGGDDFNYGRNEGELTDDKAKDLANIIAKDKDGNNIPSDLIKVDQDQLDKLNDALTNGDIGTFPLTFTEPDGKEIVVEVTIYDNVIHSEEPDNKQEFGGNNFDYDTQDGKLTEEKAKDLADIYAKDKLGLDIPLEQIHVNQGDLDKLNDAIANGKSGEFEVKFTTDDGQELIVTVTLFDGKVEPSDDNGTGNGTGDGAGNGAGNNTGSGTGNNTGNGAGNNTGSGTGIGNSTGNNSRIPNNAMTAKYVRGVRTGDIANIRLWIALALMAGTTLLIVVARRKKQQK